MDYRLVTIETATHKLDDGRECGAYSSGFLRCDQCHPRPSFKLPAMGSALIVPPPPDYSTPKAVSARCRERGTGGMPGFQTAANDRSVAKAYRELRKIVPAMPCRVEDTHVSKWIVVWIEDEYQRQGVYSGQTVVPAHYAMVPKPEPILKPARKPRARKAA
jgi:hypothetical protein